MKDASIYINYEQYKKIYSDSNRIKIIVNFDEIIFTEALLDLFIYNQNYYRIFKKALFDKFNVNIVVLQNDDIIIKKVYSPISILMGINNLNKELPNKFAFNIPPLLNKIDFKKYISKNKNKIFCCKIDNSLEEIKYFDLTKIILDRYEFDDFLNKPKNDCRKQVFLLKEFMKQERIFISYLLSNENLDFYKFLIQKYDTEAFNKNAVSNFKYSEKCKLNRNFEFYLLNINTDNILKKVIYVYLNIITTLKYDYEEIDSKIIKKHKDFTRIECIDKNNNRVANYEFSLIFAKCLEKLNLNFDYNDDFIIVRINKYILKFKSISLKYNNDKLSIFDFLKEIELLNNNENSKKEYNIVVNEIFKELSNKKFNKEILNMKIDDLNNIYKINSSKKTISFNKKYEMFFKLISNVNMEFNAIGYILELKKILFNNNELNANIKFSIIEENKNPIVIITINKININLYNSNKYIYYNPPNKLEELNLNEIRASFFNGRFKYIKSSESIIGIEKSNI